MRSRRNTMKMFLVMMLALALGCEKHETTRDQGGGAQQDAKPGVAMGGSIASVRSGSGGTGGLSAQGNAGKRSLAPGDRVTGEEIVQTDAGLEVSIFYDDGTSLVLGENSRAGFVGGELAVKDGEVSIARPLGSGAALALSVGRTTFAMTSGRATVHLNQGRGRMQILAGEIQAVATGARYRAGQSLNISPNGKITTDLLSTAASNRLVGWIESLAPEAYRIPTPANLLRGIGTLTARVPGSGKKNEMALDLVNHAVNVSMREGIALTNVEEAFTNRSGRTVEATYKFLLPSGASITRLALDVNGRIEEGEVLEKKRARRIFKQIVDDSVRPRDPALLEWEQGSTFSMKIFPIKPGETRRVFISYMEPMTASDGYVRYIYPMGGPAGTPDIGEFSMNIDIESPHGISAVRTPLYPTEINAQGDRAVVSFSAQRYAPSADFVLEYATKKDPVEMRVATETEKNGQSYAMAIFRPEVTAAVRAEPVPARLLAVVDTSYGTTEDIRALTSSTVVELLASLGPNDMFNILACDSGCRAFSRGFEKPSLQGLSRVHEFLAAIEPGGASDILGAMEQAFTWVSGGGPATIVYLGDGVPTSGELDAGKLLRILEQTRPSNAAVQTVGVGPDVDGVLLDAMAASMGGSSYRLSVGESPAVAAWNVARRINAPGLKDVTFQWPASVGNTYPDRIGFIPSGSEIVLTAALTRPRGVPEQVIVRATDTNGAPYEKRFEISMIASPPAPGFIGKLWAKDHIDYLQFQGGRDKEIIDISRRMRVASRLTSWIVLENQQMYDRFKVQRTEAEMWDGQAASFAEAFDEDAEDKADALALDSLALADNSALGMLGSGAMGGSAAPRGGMGKTGEGYAAASPAATAKAEQAKAPSAKKSKAKPSSAPLMQLESEKSEDSDSLKDDRAARSSGIATSGPSKEYGGGGGYGYGRPRHCGYRTVYNIKIGPPASYGPAATNKAEQLAARVRQNPLSRSGHRRYVRILSRLGHVEKALAAAKEWRNSDPMGTGALSAYADQIARHGHRDAAMRMYSSIAELEPRSAKIHLRLANAFRDLGDYGAAAGHYRAAAARDKKKKNEFMLDYLFCLAASGQLPLLDIEVRNVTSNRKYRSIHDKVADLVAGARNGVLPAWPAKGFKGAMTVKLTTDSPDVDLDLAVIDPAGRRISGLWRRGASAKNVGLIDEETLSVHFLRNGSYQILVSRSDAASSRPVSGKVTVRVRDKRKTLFFTLTGAETAVGQVKYKKKEEYRCN